jgi:hypothetical protein
VPATRRQIDILGFSAGSYTWLALHEVLWLSVWFECSGGAWGEPCSKKEAAQFSDTPLIRFTGGWPSSSRRPPFLCPSCLRTCLTRYPFWRFPR